MAAPTLVSGPYPATASLGTSGGSFNIPLPSGLMPTVGNLVLVVCQLSAYNFFAIVDSVQNAFTYQDPSPNIAMGLVFLKTWTIGDANGEDFATIENFIVSPTFPGGGNLYYVAYELSGTDPLVPFGGYGTLDDITSSASFSPDTQTATVGAFAVSTITMQADDPLFDGGTFSQSPMGWSTDYTHEDFEMFPGSTPGYSIGSSFVVSTAGSVNETVSSVQAYTGTWEGNFALINGPSGGGGSNALATQVGLEQFGSAPSHARATQVGFEVYGLDTASMIRATQVGFEQFGLAPSSARATQVGLELFGTPPSFERVTQLGLEIFGSPPVTPQFAEWLDFNPAAGSPAGTLNITFPGSVAINGIWMPTYTSDVNVYANNVFVMTAFASVGSQVVPMPIGTTTVTLTTNPSAASFFVFATTQSINPRGAF